MGNDDRQPGRNEGEDELRDQTVDEMFAAMMADYHLTAPGRETSTSSAPSGAPAEADPQRVDLAPDPADQPGPATKPVKSDEPISWTPRTGNDWIDEHPLFTRPGPPDEPADFTPYRPDPQPPMGVPRWPVLVGWGCMGWALVAALLVIFGVDLPSWAGWLAVLGFLGGFGLLISQLPRHRPPDSGDGAVL